MSRLVDSLGWQLVQAREIERENEGRCYLIYLVQESLLTINGIIERVVRVR